MAQFYADIQGNRGVATRMGTKASGISGHVRGWNVGCRVWCYHDNEEGVDKVSIQLTSGSKGYKSPKCLGTFTAKDLG
jgi:hypothetical protein